MARYFDDYAFTEELTHHGVKGMRWGVRRSRTARLYSEGSPRKSRSSGQASKPKKRSSLLSKIYGVNERHYSKKSRKAYIMEQLNKSAREESERRAAKYKKSGKKVRAAILNAAAKNYGINEKYYGKKRKRNRLMADMNRRARERSMNKKKK